MKLIHHLNLRNSKLDRVFEPFFYDIKIDQLRLSFFTKYLARGHFHALYEQILVNIDDPDYENRRKEEERELGTQNLIS